MYMHRHSCYHQKLAFHMELSTLHDMLYWKLIMTIQTTKVNVIFSWNLLAVQFRLYKAFELLSKWSTGVYLRFCALGHAAGFALVENQRKHHAWTIPFHQSLTVTSKVIEPNQLCLNVFNHLNHLTSHQNAASGGRRRCYSCCVGRAILPIQAKEVCPLPGDDNMTFWTNETCNWLLLDKS